MAKAWRPLSLLTIVALIGLGGLLAANSSATGLPDELKAKVDFKVIYPTGGNFQLLADSYHYLDQTKTLVFKALTNGQTVNLSEQATPPFFDLESVVASASQTLTEGKGYRLIESKLGQAAITNFYSEKSLTKIGQSAILNSNGTLLTVQLPTGIQWGQAEWENFFNHLAVGK
ncbi:hypothetical protein HY380_01075 [Candidatus Saccharibacteria bacterium]|nr:hypothetical protein [Candidatus Saccharibacteria bacterium]